MRHNESRFVYANFSPYPSIRWLKEKIIKEEARLFEEKIERDLKGAKLCQAR